MAETILVVDDEKSVIKALRMTLESKYRVISSERGDKAKELFKKERPDLVLLDIGLPDISGIEVLKSIREIDSEALAVMATAVEDIKTVVEAVKLGAYDYLVKPINAQELFLTIGNALESFRLKNQIRIMQQSEIDRYNLDFVGQSKKINNLLAIAKKVSTSIDTPILILGESGAGKGVLARAIHYSNKNAPGPFVTVNCGAISKELVESELFGYEQGAFTGAKTDGKKGHFEASAGGTLFLDEIGAMPVSSQAKLLGVLEDRIFQRVGGTRLLEVSSRIIAATNVDLLQAVEDGWFRKDLYFRLNVVKIEVPPLRERRDDILILAEHFITNYNHKFGKNFYRISPEAKKILTAYSWPGNVRELRNLIERIVLLEDGDTLSPGHLIKIIKPIKDESKIAEIDNLDKSLDYEEMAHKLIKKAMNRTGGNITNAAGLLNMPVHKLRYRIKKFKLKRHQT